MKYDPAIMAVRDARHRISASVGHDPVKLVEYYIQLQERHRERIMVVIKPPAGSPDDAEAVSTDANP